MPNIFQGDVLLVIFLILLLIFGGRKLPELARSIGKARKEFKKGMDEADEEESEPEEDGAQSKERS